MLLSNLEKKSGHYPKASRESRKSLKSEAGKIKFVSRASVLGESLWLHVDGAVEEGRSGGRETSEEATVNQGRDDSLQ